jgi:perosamine synthetase
MIPLSTPHLNGNEWKYMKECLDTQWVSSVGPFVDRFEKEVADYVGAKHAIAVVNGTSALHIALQIAGVQENDEVLVSDLTFVASVNSILYCNAKPVFMDVDYASCQMDFKKVEAFLTEECEKTPDGLCRNKATGRIIKVLMPVHILGFSAEIDSLVNLAKSFNIKVVEDSAEGLGVRFRDKHVGTFGDLGILSFNGNKIITCGGGGIILTNDTSYANRAKYLTTQAKNDPIEFDHHEMGYNYRLTNVQAALGVAQLEQLGEFVDAKLKIAKNYEESLKTNPLISFPKPFAGTLPTYWMYTVLINFSEVGKTREEVIKKMIDMKIGVRPFWKPAHTLPYLSGFQNYQIENSLKLYEQGICLPCSVHLTEEDQNNVCETIKNCLNT